MTHKAKLLALAEAVEKLSGPDRAMDRDIARSQGWHRVEPRFNRSKHGAWISPEDFIGTMSDGSPILDSLHGTEMHREVPAFTGSIDRAVTLVPKGWWWSVGDCSVSADASVGPDVAHCDGETLRRYDSGIHCDIPQKSSPALALCAAALRAQAEALA